MTIDECDADEEKRRSENKYKRRIQIGKKWNAQLQREWRQEEKKYNTEVYDREKERIYEAIERFIKGKLRRHKKHEKFI